MIIGNIRAIDLDTHCWHLNLLQCDTDKGVSSEVIKGEIGKVIKEEIGKVIKGEIGKVIKGEIDKVIKGEIGIYSLPEYKYHLNIYQNSLIFNSKYALFIYELLTWQINLFN